MMGDGSAVVAIYLRLGTTGHPWNIAILAMVTALPLIIFSPISGFVIDNYSAKRILSGLALFEALTCVAIGYFHGVAITLTLMGILNMGMAFTFPGFAAYLPTILGEENITKASGVMQTAQGVSQVFGPAFGGFLVGTVGQSWPLYIDAMVLCCSVFGIALLSVDRRPDPDHVRAKKGERDLGSGFRMLYNDRPLFWWSISSTAFILMLGMIFVADVFFVTKTLHASAFQYGLTSTFFGIGTVVGALMAARLPQKAKTLVTFGEMSIAGIGITFAGVGLVESIYYMYPLLLVGGLFVGYVNVCYNSMVMIRAAEEFRGRIGSASGAIFTSGNLGATALGGVLLMWFAPRTVFQVGGVASLVTVLLFGPLCFRALKNESRTLSV